MNCVNHSQIEAAGSCDLCGVNYCDDCLVSLAGNKYCKKCLSEKAGTVESAPVMSPRKKSKFWAFLFSIVPGVGYLYLGLMTRGLQTLTLFFGSIFLANLIGFEEIMAVVAPVIMFYSIFETQQLVEKMNQGYEVEDRQFVEVKKMKLTQNWIGYGLLIIGVLALFHNIMPYNYELFYEIKRFLAPALITGLGVYILYRNSRKSI